MICSLNNQDCRKHRPGCRHRRTGKVFEAVGDLGVSLLLGGDFAVDFDVEEYKDQQRVLYG